MMTVHSSSLGKQGEQYVARYLESQGFALVAHNYVRKAGEIDIIAQKKDLLVFVEVKTRYGDPLFDMTELIGYSKQKKIITVAKQFLALHNITEVSCRFDVALLVQHSEAFELNYIPDAFQENI